MATKKLYNVFEPSTDALKASTFAKSVYIKQLRAPEDLTKWKRSLAYRDLVSYINNTSMAIQGHRLDGDYTVTKQMNKLCQIFNWLEVLLYQCHPLGPGQGMLRCVGEDKMNLLESSISLMHKCHDAYRHWIKLVQEKIFIILERQVKPHCKHINELAQYLTRSFGSTRHFDYGPGNELMFLFYLCGLFKSGILQGEDTIAAGLLLYPRYLQLARRLVSFYRLSSDRERDNNPNHICSIDNHNILPYIWGCAQLCRNAPFAPPQWEQAGILEAHQSGYMLLGSLKHLQKIVNIEGDAAVLGMHSYQLWCVLGMSNWPDAYGALMACYTKHILNDFYTAQDLIFCEMMSIARQPFEQLDRARMGELPEPETPAPASIVSFKLDAAEEQEVEKEHQIIEIMPKVEQIDAVIEPPLSRHQSLETNVVLGFYDPQKARAGEETKNPKRLRQLRQRHDEHDGVPKSLTVVFPHNQAPQNFPIEESVYDITQIKEPLGIQKDSSKLNSTESFFSI